MKFEDLFETPLVDLGAIETDRTNSSFRPSDQKAIEQYLGVKKYKLENTFSKTPYNFQIYFRDNNSDGTGTGSGHNPVKYYRGNIDSINGQHANRIGTVPKNSRYNELKNSQAITIVITNNEGIDRVALTPWMIAHRIVHSIWSPKLSISNSIINSIYVINAILSRKLAEINKELYQELWQFFRFKKIASLIGDTRSIREQNLTTDSEIFIDMITQYIVKGPLIYDAQKVNNYYDSLKLSEKLSDEHLILFDEKIEQLKQLLEKLVDEINKFAEHILSNAVGQVFVI